MGVGVIVYSIAFVVVLRSNPKSAAVVLNLVLLLGGLLTTAVFIAIYERVRSVDSAFALWALVFGLAGLHRVGRWRRDTTGELDQATQDRSFGGGPPKRN